MTLSYTIRHGKVNTFYAEKNKNTEKIYKIPQQDTRRWRKYVVLLCFGRVWREKQLLAHEGKKEYTVREK
jgi:hypothetical protein